MVDGPPVTASPWRASMALGPRVAAPVAALGLQAFSTAPALLVHLGPLRLARQGEGMGVPPGDSPISIDSIAK